MIAFSDEQMAEARRKLIESVFVLTAEPLTTPNRAARNVIYHCEELMKALDAFWSGRDPDEADA